MRNEDILNRTALTDFLLKTSSYPHHPESVEHIQTHASDVFIASPYVYKVKKPVDFGFLDFTTLEKRKYYLEQELVLNRRLTSGIYLEVLEISLKEQIHIRSRRQDRRVCPLDEGAAPGIFS